MAKKREQTVESNDDFTDELIKAINRDNGDRIAYNLSTDDAPTNVNRWLSTGCIGLDYICANRSNGGFPEGRIVEIYGPASIGKSHIALQLARCVQKIGGIVIYIDTENATSIENLNLLGVNIKQKFVYVQEVCVENIFSIIDQTVKKAHALNNDIPVLVVWDSIAAASPKAELLGDYDKDTIGLKARALSKGFRKLTETIGANKVTLLCLNQIRTRIGVSYVDPDVSPGGHALPFHASIRIKLGAGSAIKAKNGDVIGINVWAKTVKNKVAPPFRKAHFEIHFGVGIKEHEQLLDLIREYCSAEGPIIHNGKRLELEGGGAWKTLSVADAASGEVILEKKYTKNSFENALSDPEVRPWLNIMLEKAHVRAMGQAVKDDEASSDNEQIVD